MADSWTTIFDETYSSRSVTGEIYSDGCYKITTTQKTDLDGTVSGDRSSTVIVPPTAAGSAMEITADTLDELKAELVSYGEFSIEEANNIVERFRRE